MASKVTFTVGDVHIFDFQGMEEIPRKHESVTIEGKDKHIMHCIVREINHVFTPYFQRTIFIDLELIRTETPDEAKEQTSGEQNG